MRNYTPSELFSVPPAVLRSGELLPKAKLILLDAMSRADSWVILNIDGSSRTLPFDKTDELRARAGLTDRKAWQKHREQLERFGCLKLIEGYSKHRHWKGYVWSWGNFWTAHHVFSLVDLADDPCDWPLAKRAEEKREGAFSLGVYTPLHIEKKPPVSVSPSDCIEIGFDNNADGAAFYERYRSRYADREKLERAAKASLSPAFLSEQSDGPKMPMPGQKPFCWHLAAYAEDIAAGRHIPKAVA